MEEISVICVNRDKCGESISKCFIGNVEREKEGRVWTERDSMRTSKMNNLPRRDRCKNLGKKKKD